MSRKKKIADIRKDHLAYIRSLKKSGLKISGFEIVTNDSQCAACQAFDGVLIPMEGCQLSNLPPFDECTNEEPCRPTLFPIFTKYPELRFKRPAK